jgi:hypothetical protein
MCKSLSLELLFKVAMKSNVKIRKLLFWEAFVKVAMKYIGYGDGWKIYKRNNEFWWKSGLKNQLKVRKLINS